MNKVILIGHLTADVDLKTTQAGGHSVASFTLAVNRRFAKDGQQQADFIRCIAWRQTAEFISRYFNKGSMIAVVGSMQTRSWDGADGKRQYATEVVVDEAYFTGSKSESHSVNGYNQTANTPADYSGAGNAPLPEQAGYGNVNRGDFDMDGFEDLDGSEDDLPF